TQKKEYESNLKKLQSEINKNKSNAAKATAAALMSDNKTNKVNTKTAVTAKDMLLKSADNKTTKKEPKRLDSPSQQSTAQQPTATTQNSSNFIYQLVSIENRKNKLWAIVAPKNYKNINQF